MVGKGVTKKNKIYKLNKLKNISLIENRENIKTFFDLSDIAIVSGGTVLFEAISSGLPTLSIINYNHQKYAINYFKKKKCIQSLKELKSLDKKKIENFIKYSLENYEAIYKKNTKIIDGKGCERVGNIITKYIN